ncbi:MAG: hypothetical protein JWL86_4529 [Rhizobium sp.]|nr:hypothetical protein [Rhizobium sp.]
MRIRLPVLLVAMIAASCISAVAAAHWTHYFNARFGYGIDIPPGFSEVQEADNSDGGVSRSAEGAAELKVWGAYLGDDDFATDVSQRVQSDTADGWMISYDRRTGENASWSGSKGAQILYMRAVKGCDGSAAYFQIVYDRSELKAYDTIVKRLVKTLRPC